MINLKNSKRAKQLSVFFFFLLFLWPLEPLKRLDVYFNSDWLNHLWTIHETSQQITATKTLPATIDVPGALLNPIPAFYSTKFYTMIAAVTSALGSTNGITEEVLIRIWLLAVLILQFYLVMRLTSISTAFVFHGAIYTWTNLYNRGALPEFIATTHMICALLLYLVLLDESGTGAKNSKKKTGLVLFAALNLALTMGTHPISGLYGFGYFAILAAIATIALRGFKRCFTPMIYACGILFLASFCNLDFAYASAKYASSLVISSTPSLTITEFDSLLFRFFPIPIDPRSVIYGVKYPTPYLDLQFNMPLLILMSAALYYGWSALKSKRWAWSLLLVLVFTILLSACKFPYALLPEKAKVIQFTFRMITYVNLIALLALILIQRTTTFAFSKKPVLLAVVLTLSFAGFVSKYVHIRAVRSQKNLTIGNDWVRYPPDFPAANVYTSNLIPEADESYPQCGKLNFKSRDETVKLWHDCEGWYETNIAAFGWNHILANGVEQPQKQKNHLLAVLLPPGTQKMTAVSTPDSAWLNLQKLSWIGLALLFSGSISTLGALLVPRVKRPRLQ